MNLKPGNGEKLGSRIAIVDTTNASSAQNSKPGAYGVHSAADNARPGHDGGSLRVFEKFSWLGAGSINAALSLPAHQRVPRGCFADVDYQLADVG
jgi:hypothetical protein